MTTATRRSARPGAKAYRACTSCGTRRQIRYDLRLRGDYINGYVCKTCRPRAAKRSYPELSRKHWLRKAYGLTPEQYDDMLRAQGGVCAICKKPPKGNRLHVDHCHETGRIRGLLCVSCNSKLEWMITYHNEAERYVKGPIS